MSMNTTAPLPLDEERRLAALERLAILDTPPEAAFDRVATLACDLLGVSAGLVNFVARDRQWGKACIRTNDSEAARAHSFCAWTILDDEPHVVPDTLDDDRFRDNPMVMGAPHIRAYLGVPLHAEDGARVGSLCVIHDTPRVFADREVATLQALGAMLDSELTLRETTRKAQALAVELAARNDALDAFTYSVSHDLRAPVRQVLSFATLARRALTKGDSGKVDTLLRTTVEAAEHANTLIDDLLRLSKLDFAPLNLQDVDVTAITREVIGTLDDESRSVAWHVHDLGHVHSDAAFVRLVLTVLLANALKYTRPRDLAEIHVTRTDTSNKASFTVRDNGVGFDPRYAHKLFGVFQRLHRAEDFEGTGVGLTIARRATERLGGTLEGSGQLNEGATFTFTLPRSKLDGR
ncbi:sensor histidine kinase [Deinococcus yavapaiensis]|uniref:histidine kinase n=1 Tax=Deinococcus yavapaiensis KR-236 TaxID=694435 RepID=A0A318S4I7_9DEIO|nr:ATP-binding protein [Deinococcus yavapaiensis]PYE50393.1 GAF sensor signal transduction histidine kinase [Deinococcus yavapaiensis KR-236]